MLTDSRASIGVQKRAFQVMGARFNSHDLRDRLEFLLNYDAGT